MNHWRVTAKIYDDAAGQEINTGASMYLGFSSTSQNTSLTVGSATITTSADSTYYFYFRAAVNSNYTFQKFACSCPSASPGYQSKEFTANPTTSAWDLSSARSSSPSSPTDITVTLHVRSSTATLTYNANGGSPTPSAQTAAIGSSITLASAPSRSGYNFAGWQINGVNYSAGASYTLSANATATAQWTQLAVYTVTYNKTASDVTGADIPSVSVTQGSSIILPDAQLWERSGYDFAGWSLTSGGAAQYQAGSSYTPNASVTFYAVWAARSGTGAQPEFYSTSQTSGSTETYRERRIGGYVFRVSSNVGTGTFNITYNTRAQGSRVQKTSTYNPNYSPNPRVSTTTLQNQSAATTATATISGSADSTASAANTSRSIEIPGDYLEYYKFTRPNSASAYYTTTETTGATTGGGASGESAWAWTAPEISGYEFDGWYTIGQKWDSSHTPTNGEFTVKLGSSRTIPFADILNGANYVRWMNSSSGSTLNQSYYNYIQVRYQGVRVLVLLDATGGDLADFYRDVRYGSAYGSLPTPTRSGYTFAGWYTAATGGTQVTAATLVTTAAQHVLYAHWTGGPNRTLTLRDAANSSVSTRTVAEGSAYGSLPSPTRTGYTFAGWWTGTVSGSQVSAATTMGDRDITIYARWTPTSLTITFDVNGGTAISPSSRTALYGQQYGTLPKAKKTGKKFDGWWTAATGGTEITATTIATASLIVYAHWRDPASVPLGYISTSGS